MWVQSLIRGLIATAIVLQLGESLAAQPAQPAAAGLVVAHQPVFAIPFHIEPSRDAAWQPIEAQLYVSVDRGEHWRLYAKVPTAQRRFNVRTNGDGEYWFAIRTADRSGQLRPRTITGPGLRVMVDTKSPASKPGQPGQSPQQLSARPAPLRPQVSMPSESPAPIVPKNSVAVSISPSVASKYLPPSGPTNDGPTLPGMPPGERPRMVREPTFDLEYDVRPAGTSGVAKVELFGTRDGGRTWRSFGIDPNRRSPMQVRVNEEGIYGFRVVVTSRAGYGPRPPVSGDQPDQWVCVDWTPPTARILSTQRGFGAELDQLTISWQAEDQMLSARPVTISYSRNRGGPWMTVASGLENTGRYTWMLDDRAPSSVYLRLEVRDEAGNIGVYDTPDPVAIASVSSSSDTAVRGPAVQSSQPSQPSEPQPDGPSLGQP